MKEKFFKKINLGKTIIHSALFFGILSILISATVAVVLIPKKVSSSWMFSLSPPFTFFNQTCKSFSGIPVTTENEHNLSPCSVCVSCCVISVGLLTSSYSPSSWFLPSFTTHTSPPFSLASSPFIIISCFPSPCSPPHHLSCSSPHTVIVSRKRERQEKYVQLFPKTTKKYTDKKRPLLTNPLPFNLRMDASLPLLTFSS